MKIIKKKNTLEIKSDSIFVGSGIIAIGLLLAFLMWNEEAILEISYQGVFAVIMLMISPLMFIGAGLLIIETRHFIFDSSTETITINIRNIRNIHENKIERYNFKDFRCFCVATPIDHAEGYIFSVHAKIKNEKIPLELLPNRRSRYNDNEIIANELNDWLSSHCESFNPSDL